MIEIIRGKPYIEGSRVVARRTKNIAWMMSRVSKGMGLSALEGTIYPLKLYWGLTRDSNDKVEKVLAVAPLVPPTLAALVSGYLTRDGSAMLWSTSVVYLIEGTLSSAVVRFISPPDNPN